MINTRNNFKTGGSFARQQRVAGRSNGVRACLAVASLCVLAGMAMGQISFAAAADVATPFTPGGSAIADFNGDGLADLAVSSESTAAGGIDRVLLFVATAPGVFGATPVIINLGNNVGAGALVAGDFDGDLDIDLAVAQQNQSSVRLIINTAGVLVPGATTATGANPRELVAIDLDGDADLDLATANRDGNSVSIMRNVGGVFTNMANVVTGGEPRAVAFADFSGDGVLDVLFSNHDDRTIRVVRATAALAFNGVATTINVGGGNRPDGVAAGDVNGDGLADALTTISDTPNAVQVYINNGAGGFGAARTFLTNGLNPSGLVLADLDGDFDLDLATNNTDSANITVMTNDGLGFFGSQLLIATGTNPQTPVVGRVDGGRMLDLVVANRDSNTTSVILNTTPPPPLCASDFNADGTVDPDDLADFVTAFFTVPPDARTDVDGNGTVNPDDLADFINAFFTGCA